jgi:hypothetical protein
MYRGTACNYHSKTGVCKMQYKENQKVFLASTGDCGTLSAAIITKISDDNMSVVKSHKCWMTGELSTSRFTASVEHWQKNQIGVYGGLPVLYWGHRNTDIEPEKYVILSNFYQLDEARGEVSA